MEWRRACNFLKLCFVSAAQNCQAEASLDERLHSNFAARCLLPAVRLQRTMYLVARCRGVYKEFS